MMWLSERSPGTTTLAHPIMPNQALNRTHDKAARRLAPSRYAARGPGSIDLTIVVVGSATGLQPAIIVGLRQIGA